VLGIFGGYLVVLAMIILCPLPGSPPPPTYHGDPGVPLLQVDTELDLRGLLSSGVDDQNLQNLVLAVPFGFGLPWALRRSAVRLAGACLLLGVGLEGAQAVASLLAGWAYRSIDINDLRMVSPRSGWATRPRPWTSRMATRSLSSVWHPGERPGHRPSCRTGSGPKPLLARSPASPTGWSTWHRSGPPAPKRPPSLSRCWPRTDRSSPRSVPPDRPARRR
jgi:hypothetical protein